MKNFLAFYVLLFVSCGSVARGEITPREADLLVHEALARNVGELAEDGTDQLLDRIGTGSGLASAIALAWLLLRRNGRLSVAVNSKKEA